MPSSPSSSSSSSSSSSHSRIKKVTVKSSKPSPSSKPKAKSKAKSELKYLAALPKIPLKKTVQGAVTKVPRLFPGMASRSTSSRSVGSLEDKSTHDSSNGTKSSSKVKVGTTIGISHSGGSIPTDVIPKEIVKNTDHASVCSSIGFEERLTSVKLLKQRWSRHFNDAASFLQQPLRGDDLTHIVEGLQKNFPQLARIQDLEVYTAYKQIMKSVAGGQKLIILLCVIYLSYATPTSVTLGSSDTVYLFSYTHMPVSENFPNVCSKKGLTCSSMINNLRDLWLKSQLYKKEKLTPTLNTHSGPTHEKTIDLKSTKMDSLNSSSSWQTIKVALIEALKSTPLLEPVGRFFENNEIELAK